jgi:hypothetical protein
MSKQKFARWALAAVLITAAFTSLAQQDDIPILRPKSQTTKPVSASLLVMCDLACNWKLDGEAKGRIEAGASVKVKVELGQHRVSAATEDGLDKLEKEIEIMPPGQTIVHIALQLVRDARLYAEQQVQREQAALVWTDPATGLMWAKKDNGRNVTWQQATDYCHNLQLAGQGDWRLPTIDELQGIYDADPDDPGYDAYKYFTKGGLQLLASEWSSSLGNALDAWFFNYNSISGPNFMKPFTSLLSDKTHIHALCVRRPTRDKAESEQVAREAQEKAARDQLRIEQMLREPAIPTWTDPATGLTWTKKDNGSDVTLQQAMEYCRNLKLASYNDWRLPTINELEGIYENKEDTYEHNVKGGLQLSAWMVWSGSKGGAYGEEWLFFFIEGKRSFVSIKDTSALCVRRPGE